MITVYADRSYPFITKTPPVAVLLKKRSALPRAAGSRTRTRSGRSRQQVEEIAKMKLPD